MKLNLSASIHLLHRAPFGALATQAVQIPGYPFATALPFVPDEKHYPVFLLSGLAEHTKNLLANPHASLLVTDPDHASVLESPRMTLVGDVERIDASPELRARYVRYQPEAAQYLELGDFTFFRQTPRRARYIGGFAQMGWLEEEEWEQSWVLGPDEEEALLRELAPRYPDVIGIDCYGMDLMQNGCRRRLPFKDALTSAEILAVAERGLA